MKVLGLGLPELLIILAVVLLIFGPKHLPKLGSALGSTVKNLREGLGSNKEETEEEVIDTAPAKASTQKSAKALEAKDAEASAKAPIATEAVAD